jgi:hypothetical protein
MRGDVWLSSKGTRFYEDGKGNIVTRKEVQREGQHPDLPADRADGRTRGSRNGEPALVVKRR